MLLQPITIAQNLASRKLYSGLSGHLQRYQLFYPERLVGMSSSGSRIACQQQIAEAVCHASIPQTFPDVASPDDIFAIVTEKDQIQVKYL